MEISTPRPQKPAHQGQFQCSTCQRTFSRVDHLTRHVRSHLQDRPFQCQTCNKAFGRPDLLKRHAACHDDQNSVKRLKRQHNTAPRVSQACRPCATAKLKCDDKKPCSRCLQRGIACKQEDRESNEREPQSDNPMPCRESPTNTGPNISVVTMDTNLQITKPTSPLPVAHDQASFEPELQDPSPFGFPEYDMSCFLRGVISSPVANTHRAIPTEEWPYRDFSSGPRGLLDFTVDSNFDFEDADFSLLDQPSSNANGIISNGHQQPTIKQGSDTTEFKDPRRHVALGTEAYRRSSLGFWEPSRHDHSASELENLSVLGPDEDASAPHFSLDEHCLGESLDRSTRDEIMAMILDTCKTDKRRSVIKAFPTRELLDNLLQNFFHHHNQQIDSYVHGPTFRPNQQEPELLGAVVATGAVLTCTRTLHKLGFAMQETVRRTLPERFNEANVLSRALWALQSFMCEIEIGIWSGIKRKMEIAESHPQILFTMLRRARQFRAHNTASSCAPLPEDVGENLHRKWLRWVEQESCRRLVYHAFIMDAQSSMAMLTSPIISFAELSTPFPEARDLWLAEDAEKWKAIYLSRPRPHAPVSLVDYLREPIEIPDHYDVHFAHLVILHGIWGMIWQHSQLQATLNRAKYSHAAVALQHQEIIQKLQRFQINILECPEPPRPETTLVLELLHMHLHLSFESIELFAGKGDLEDARQVFPSLQQWFNSSESRQAIWHGGQVIRAARTFHRNHLRGFYAIAVYQASLAIWAYSMIFLAKGMREEGPAQAQTTMPEAVCLDGPDSPAVQRFITLGKGIPSWSQPHRASGKPALPVPLSDQETIMNAILETLEGNFPCHLEREAPPPLVENLTQLLRELGKAAAGVKA